MKIIATIAALFIAITSYAQEGLREGYKMLGGSFSFNVSESDDDYLDYFIDDSENRYTSFGFSPYYGRFYADNQLIGLRFGVLTSTSANQYVRYLDSTEQIERRNSIDRNSTNLSLGVFWRYYLPMNDKIGFLVEPALSGYWERNEYHYLLEHYHVLSYEQNDVNEYEANSTGYGVFLSLNAGFYFFPLPQLSLEVLLGNFVTDFAFGKTTSIQLEELEIENEHNYTSFNITFKAANSFRFDELIRLNYYF